MRRITLSSITNISELQHRILHDEEFFATFLIDMSINTTEMFRDPDFYLEFRKIVVPILKTYPSIKIWHAGCSTGQEVYSMAILLKEEGLYDKSLIYATDFNEKVVEISKAGIYSIDGMKENTSNYQKSGGQASFSDYYTAGYNSVIMNTSLKNKMVFATHNLEKDRSFGEMNVIFCRNVMIYFNRILQNKVFGLFKDSLIRRGIICLGSKESVRFSDYSDSFKDLSKKEKIYQKVN